VLPLVFGAMAVLTLFFFIMSFLSSGQTQVASHFVDSAHSLAIARAGAEWAVTKYASGSYEFNPTNKISDLFFGTSTKEDEFELQYPVELLRYLEDELNGGELVVKMRIFDITPMPLPDKLEGFKPDPIEKSGTVEFTAIGKVGKASRKVRIRKGFKVVMMVHPVLSKFTLFVREMLNNQEINVLELKTNSSDFENGCRPIILNNQGFDETGTNRSFGVVKKPSREFDLSLVTKNGFAQLVADSGWVFLNSKSPQPWMLNLVGGGNRSDYDDRLLLRLGLYERTDLEAKYHLKNKQTSTGEEITALWESFQGIKSDYYTVRKGANVLARPDDVLSTKALFGMPSPPRCPSPKCALIRPFGTGLHFSPTLMFGPVYMQYLVFRGLDVKFDYGAFYPNVLIPGFLDESDFASAFYPLPTVNNILAQFGKFLDINNPNNVSSQYSDYSEIMTTIDTRLYLDALDYIFMKEREGGSMDAPKSATYTTPLKKMIEETTPSLDIRPWVGDRGSLQTASGIFGMDTPIFAGSLANIKGCREFQAKITAVFASFKELEAGFLEKKTSQLRLPGIVYIGDTDLILDKDLEITSPGIIICGGNVCIKSAIKSKHPVTIVSLKDITVETSQLIEAHLICLMGTFRATNGFNIIGGLAACSIDTSNMKTGEKNITFVSAHDPYSTKDKWDRKAAYRYQLSQEEEYFIEGGK